MKLTKYFYLRNDVVKIARDLIGKILVTQVNEVYTSGIITETEAYNGIYDQACHAFKGRRTPRNEIMYSKGGTAYIYLCYGIHHLFNVVTNQINIPDAILIRAIYPLDGLEEMMIRRKKDKLDKSLTGGPGTVSQAMGLHTGFTGKSLLQGEVWIEDRGFNVASDSISITSRIGVECAGDDALLPYRFLVKNNYFDTHSAIQQFRKLKKRRE